MSNVAHSVVSHTWYKGASFLSHSTERTHNIQSYINCNTDFVIYLVSCNSCRLQYVGCTQQKQKDHIRRHLSDVSLSGNRIVSAVSKHCADVHNGSILQYKSKVLRESLPMRGGDYRKKTFGFSPSILEYRIV